MSTIPTGKAMHKIDRSRLMTLEEYARQRADFRLRVIEHKKRRRVSLGEHVTLHFEDELTVRYQVQEMLRAERTFEEAGIQDELDAYNPLIPDGRNLKATMMIEFPEPAERSVWLARLIGIEDRVWIQAESCAKVWAIADEDLDRETADKTSAVHFVRFELTEEMAQMLKYGVGLAVGIDHPSYRVEAGLPVDTRNALVEDIV